MCYVFFVLLLLCVLFCLFFFFNDTATTEIYTLSLHDALPICGKVIGRTNQCPIAASGHRMSHERSYSRDSQPNVRSEEHTSELQSQSNLVCRLLLEKKKKQEYKDETDSATSHSAQINIPRRSR